MHIRKVLALLFLSTINISPLQAMEEEFQYTQEDIEYAHEVIKTRIENINQIIKNIAHAFDAYDEVLNITDKGNQQRFQQLTRTLLSQTLVNISNDIEGLIFRLKDQRLPERRLASKSLLLKKHLLTLNDSIEFILLRLTSLLENKQFLTSSLIQEINNSIKFWKQAHEEVNKLITPLILQRYTRRQKEY